MARWDFGWHHQERRTINVHEAIVLRDNDTLKSGDLFCCRACVDRDDGVRLHPVDAVKRAKHLRRDPRYNPNQVRTECIKRKESMKKGESWKHARVLEAVEFLIDHGLGAELGFVSHERIRGEHRPDLFLKGGEGREDSHLLVQLKNRRRAVAIQRRHKDAKILHIHRWREADTDFIQYIRNRMKALYTSSATEDADEHLDQIFSIPCLGLRPDRTATNPLVGKGMNLKIKPEHEEDSFEFRQLQSIEDLVERVQEHNMWAISTPGEHRFETKRLRFVPFEGPGRHPDPSIDALLAVITREVGHPGVEFPAYPDQIQLRRDVLTNPETIQGMAADLSDELQEDEIPLSEDDALAYIRAKVVPEMEQEIADMEASLEPFSQAKKDALSWLAKSHSRAFKKLYAEGRVQETDNGQIQLQVEDNWYDWPGPREDLGFAEVVAPELLAPWDALTIQSRKNCLRALKKEYKQLTMIAGVPMIWTPLVNFELGCAPEVLTDMDGLVSRLHDLDRTVARTFEPLTVPELMELCYYLSADKIMTESKHPVFYDLMWASNSSTEHLQRKVSFNLPQPIEDLLSGEGNVADQMLALVAEALLSRHQEE